MLGHITHIAWPATLEAGLVYVPDQDLVYVWDIISIISINIKFVITYTYLFIIILVIILVVFIIIFISFNCY